MGLLSRLFSRPEPVKGRIPRERVLYRFRAREDFYSEEVRSQYAKGDIYSVRSGNDKLDKLVKGWLTDNKVEVL